MWIKGVAFRKLCKLVKYTVYYIFLSKYGIESKELINILPACLFEVIKEKETMKMVSYDISFKNTFGKSYRDLRLTSLVKH